MTPNQQRESTNQTQTAEGRAPTEFDRLLNQPVKMEFVPYGGKDSIKLSIDIVQKLIAVPTRSGKTCSPRDAAKFMMMCQAKRLNPFEGDAFLIGYDGKDGPEFSLITAHQAFLKRAELHPEYDGMASGVIVQDKDGNLHELEGDFHLPDQKPVGGWAKVFLKTRSHPTLRRIRLERFNKGFAQWRDDPAGMICKCAEADALRSSFPTMLGGLYLREEGVELFGLDQAMAGIEPKYKVATPNISTAPTDDSNPELNPAPRRGRPKKSSGAGQTQPPQKQDPNEQGNDPAPAPEPTSNVRTIKEDTIMLLIDSGVPFEDFASYLVGQNIYRDADSFTEFDEIKSEVYDAIQGDHLAKIIKTFKSDGGGK